jgi:hypothetical protein
MMVSRSTNIDLVGRLVFASSANADGDEEVSIEIVVPHPVLPDWAHFPRLGVSTPQAIPIVRLESDMAARRGLGVPFSQAAMTLLIDHIGRKKVAQIEAERGKLSAMEALDITARVLRLALGGRIVITGRPLPVAANRSPIKFSEEDIPLYTFWLGKDTAHPVVGEGVAFDGLRVLSPEEWRDVQIGAPQEDGSLADGSETSRSGASGRPTSMHLVLQELRERYARGEMLSSQNAEAIYLSGWLKARHPRAHQLLPNSVRSGARFAAEHRKLTHCRKSSA